MACVLGMCSGAHIAKASLPAGPGSGFISPSTSPSGTPRVSSFLSTDTASKAGDQVQSPHSLNPPPTFGCVKRDRLLVSSGLVAFTIASWRHVNVSMQRS